MTGECGSTGTASRPPRLVYICTAPTYPYHDPHRDYWYACSIILAKQIPKKKRKKKERERHRLQQNVEMSRWTKDMKWYTRDVYLHGGKKKNMEWVGVVVLFLPVPAIPLTLSMQLAVVTVLEQRNSRIICCRKKSTNEQWEKGGSRKAWFLF